MNQRVYKVLTVGYAWQPHPTKPGYVEMTPDRQPVCKVKLESGVGYIHVADLPGHEKVAIEAAKDMTGLPSARLVLEDVTEHYVPGYQPAVVHDSLL